MFRKLAEMKLSLWAEVLQLWNTEDSGVLVSEKGDLTF